MGDFNLDLFHYDQHAFTQEFMDSLFSYMFIPLINKPTQLTSHSATLIDNIFTNCPSQNTVNGIILNDMSDHLPILAFLSSELVPHKKEAKSYRDYNEQNLIKFRTSLSLVDWTSVVVGHDPNKLFNSFSAE